MEKTTLVLYQGLGVTHMSPMLELSKSLLRHAGGALGIAVVLAESPFEDSGFAAAVARARATNPFVAYVFSRVGQRWGAVGFAGLGDDAALPLFAGAAPLGAAYLPQLIRDGAPRA